MLNATLLSMPHYLTKYWSSFPELNLLLYFDSLCNVESQHVKTRCYPLLFISWLTLLEKFPAEVLVHDEFGTGWMCSHPVLFYIFQITWHILLFTLSYSLQVTNIAIFGVMICVIGMHLLMCVTEKYWLSSKNKKKGNRKRLCIIMQGI